jgi:hypothetical protein
LWGSYSTNKLYIWTGLTNRYPLCIYFDTAVVVVLGRRFGVDLDSNFISETGRNETKIDVQTSSKNSTEAPFALFPTKAPSKNLGPLLIYTNHENGSETTQSPLESYTQSNLPSNENPFYHKSNKDENKEPFLGPFNPTYKKPSDSKNQKGQKPKPVKEGGLFVTPPPGENYIPNHQVKKPQMHGNQDELLQFIHQHPEINNYPSGSVVEVHSVPVKPSNPFANPGVPNGRPQNFIPYVLPPNGHGNELPGGITVEQILQEVHKNANPHGHLYSFPPTQFNNGPVLLAPQSPVLPNRHNSTYQGLWRDRIEGSFLIWGCLFRSNVSWKLSKYSRVATAG